MTGFVQDAIRDLVSDAGADRLWVSTALEPSVRAMLGSDMPILEYPTVAGKTVWPSHSDGQALAVISVPNEMGVIDRSPDVTTIRVTDHHGGNHRPGDIVTDLLSPRARVSPSDETSLVAMARLAEKRLTQIPGAFVIPAVRCRWRMVSLPFSAPQSGLPGEISRPGVRHPYIPGAIRFGFEVHHDESILDELMVALGRIADG